MKRRTPLRFLPVIGALAFLSTASVIAAQRGQASLLGSNNAFKESRKIKIKLVRDDNGKIITVTQFVGKMITVTFNAQSFALLPKVDDQSGAVSLVLHSIEGEVGDSIRPAKELETIGVSKALPARSSTVDLPFSIMIDEKSEVSGEPIRPTPTPAGFKPGLRGFLPTPVLKSAALGEPRDARWKVPTEVFQAELYGGDVCCVTCDGIQTDLRLCRGGILRQLLRAEMLLISSQFVGRGKLLQRASKTC